MIERIKQMLTERDNATTCPVRVIIALGVVIYHLGAGFGVALGSIHIGMAELGQYVQHMMTVVGVSGGALGVKSVLKGDAA